jgi:hypothetical protein
MGKIIYPQKKEIKGPWLIDQDNFESLNIVIETIDDLLSKSWINQIEIEVKEQNKNVSEDESNKLIEDRKNRNYSNKHIKKCEITSKDETKLSDESILGILKDKTLEKLNPKSFSVSIIHGTYYENSFDLKVSNLYQGELRYDINCFDPSIQNEIQYEIDKWIDKRKPNRALQVWSNYGDLIIFTFIVPLFLLAIQSFSTSFTTYQESLSSEMLELAKTGVNEINRDLALELMLKSKSGYVPSSFEPIEKPNNPIWIRLFVVSVFIYIVSIFRPKTLIELGEMKNKLAIYNIWIKLVLVTLPAILILGPFWKIIVKWFY